MKLNITKLDPFTITGRSEFSYLQSKFCMVQLQSGYNKKEMQTVHITARPCRLKFANGPQSL